MSETATNPPAAAPVIELRDVAVTAIKNLDATVAEKINWTVRAGEFWVLAGVQGEGKGDLIMMLGGLMPPASGDYHFFGERMPIFEEERLATRLRLGLVFENGQLFSRMTIAENIALPLRYHQDLSRDEMAARVSAIMELTELTPFANSTPGNLPRNWQKRAGLARALALRPEVLLLNNPLAGLDARHAHWWLNFLSRLSRGQSAAGDKPMTIIATANDLSPVTGWRNHARHIACLTEKRLVTFRDWPELERSSAIGVRDFFRAVPTAIDQPDGI